MSEKARFHIDQDADIFYASFGIGEPTYAKEVDDIVVLEFGMFSNKLSGFSILDFSKYSKSELQGAISKALAEIHREHIQLNREYEQREKEIKKFKLAPVF